MLERPKGVVPSCFLHLSVAPISDVLVWHGKAVFWTVNRLKVDPPPIHAVGRVAIDQLVRRSLFSDDQLSVAGRVGIADFLVSICLGCF